MRATRITDNGFEITNVRTTVKISIWQRFKDKIKSVFQKLGTLAKSKSTDDSKRRK